MSFFAQLLVVVALVQTAYGFAPSTSSRRSMTMRVTTPGETENLPTSTSSSSANIAALRNVALPTVSAMMLLAPLLSQKANADEPAVSVPAPAPPAAKVVEKVVLGPIPTDFALKTDYYTDCQQVVDHMRYAVQMEKGNNKLAEVAQKTKDEMSEFVSFYRRFNGINGRQSFSLLYTSVNVLAGHYTSYGVKFPVPEKRRKRLLQEMNDIEKNIRKKR
mmetsp:Transcript_29171/g.27955  ORF Transcript_29171/g.27955 Transcript_29171/m.27955 type:complete len:218 (-) Transcript_29171:134-787(-)|eukprot:CAMPEP_0119040712 /NCGR_PEP_ID=MMETSP1177-20130426/10720_1 /TAXON_ID=2985 /ORGANISM="Ochromonas sp, Strain CCMP1899" /LENGTH=217 /DNA_ID=CAMNT_0007006023 /DNA_START=145 /DNA_END=798 /DNA_ORIENTATION=+